MRTGVSRNAHRLPDAMTIDTMTLEGHLAGSGATDDAHTLPKSESTNLRADPTANTCSQGLCENIHSCVCVKQRRMTSTLSPGHQAHAPWNSHTMDTTRWSLWVWTLASSRMREGWEPNQPLSQRAGRSRVLVPARESSPQTMTGKLVEK